MVRRKSKSTRNYSSIARTFILVLIPIVVIVVIVAIICANLTTPERLVQSKLDTLVANYYENDFYPSVLSSDYFSGDITATFEKYEPRGFPTLTLRQLLASDQAGLSSSDVDYLLAHCDEDTTTVKIHPTPPYNQSDYRVDYTYSCEY